MDYVLMIAEIVTILALFLIIKQIILSKNANTFTALKSIYDENLKIRKTYEQGEKLIPQIYDELKNNDDFTKIQYIYGKDKYNQLREIGYHFEFIGILVKKK